MFYLHRQFDVFKSFDNIDINRQLHTGQRKVREADFFFSVARSLGTKKKEPLGSPKLKKNTPSNVWP